LSRSFYFGGEKIRCAPRNENYKDENQEMDSHYLASVHAWEFSEERLGNASSASA
jgi:hypothetical protein